MPKKPTNNQIAIKLTGISKDYAIHHEKPTLVEKFIKGKNEKFKALDNINLTINKGERVGIFGPNGSGKTTLLKIITGITTPSKGKINRYGKVVSLIDLESGFHPELSGYQNVYQNGMLLGMTKKEIGEKLPDIITFADIRQFIDTPMFTYSQGMILRLGFSIALFSDPDIFIFDEIIGVGDEAFRKKAMNLVYKRVKKGCTLLVSLHFIDYLKNNTNKIIYLEKGKIKKISINRKKLSDTSI